MPHHHTTTLPHYHTTPLPHYHTTTLPHYHITPPDPDTITITNINPPHAQTRTRQKHSRHHPKPLLQPRFPRIPNLPDDGHHLMLSPSSLSSSGKNGRNEYKSSRCRYRLQLSSCRLVADWENLLPPSARTRAPRNLAVYYCLGAWACLLACSHWCSYARIELLHL